MTTVCILSWGERGEGVSIISAHPDVNAAKRAAWAVAQRGDTFKLMDWRREGNYWTVTSSNGVDFLQIQKVKVQP